MAQRKIMLIDGSSLAYRAFFSILDIERFKNKSGLHTNALYSFKRMLDSLLEQFQPTHVLVAFDKSERTFRTEQFAEYKGGRDKTPSEFKEQMPYLRVMLDGFGMKYYELLRYEADDIIGTLSRMADVEDEVIVVSGDKDLIQLANERVTVYITRKGVSDLEAYTPTIIEEKYRLTPEQIIDLKGLMGDSSDNYPGIERVGEKTALKLLYQFGTVEALYERLDELKPSKMKENIIRDEKNARLSKSLARIVCDAPIEVSLSDCVYRGKDLDLLRELYTQMEFRSFLAELVASDSAIIERDETTETQQTMVQATVLTDILPEQLPTENSVFHIEVLDENYHVAPLLAVGWTLEESYYVTTPELAFTNEYFRAYIQNAAQFKVMYDSKALEVLCQRQQLSLAGIVDDMRIAHYLVEGEQGDALESINQTLNLGIQLVSDEVFYGKGAKQQIPEFEKLADHVAAKLAVITQLPKYYHQRLVELSMIELYREIELPLARVLAKMEIHGVKVDEVTLQEMNDTLLQQLAEIETEIHDLAGETFNINSPKQLAVILFEKLQLPVMKKTKTGYSTAADVLEKLVGEHPIIERLLLYRQLAKLQGTYLAGLPKYILEDGKIHTRFVQTLTQTGRLSSTDPNLQNIPIRLEEGRKIRQAFIPSQEGWVLFGADYSQIELRVLAHISNDLHMQQAFRNGEDIHAATAKRVFGLAEDAEVTSQERRQAKAVNFGIVYGISDYGLSQNLNMPRKEANQFIKRYLSEYAGVATFMDEIVQLAKKQGYVTTMFHRRRDLPDIYSNNFNIRSFAERTAMNTPIQGTAADIIKVAMVRLDQEMTARNLKAKLLLQVHDELILETPEDELPILAQLVPEVMEQAVQLSVPLEVDAGSGANWYDLK